jgi:carnitine-CoA ligase
LHGPRPEASSYLDATLPSIILGLEEVAPDAILVRTTDGERLTTGELCRRMRTVAGRLAEVGLTPGDRVAAMLPNGLELIEALFATTYAGGVFVPLNTAWRGRSLEYILTDSEPRVVITDPAHVVELREAAGRLGADLIVTGDCAHDSAALAFHDLRTGEDAVGPPALKPQELAILLYTSGTTGRSKGNMLSHRASLWMAATAAATIGYTADDVVHSSLPLFHANALQCGLLGAILSGAEFVTSGGFTASGFWREVRDCGATQTALLGSMMPLLVAREPGPQDQEHRVRVAYCAPLPEDLPRFEQRFGLKCASTYGLTDANILTVRPADESGVRSCGVASPDWELALVDDADQPVAAGAIGELVGRPRRPFITSSGYWRKPEASAELWRNLWCHSGDLLRQDAEGRYHFVDRKKDAIRKGGENISSFEVEEVLLTHPGVAEATVFAVPSDLAEDDVMAVLVPVAGAEVRPEDIFAACIRELPFFAVPRYIELATELPRTENHRVRKTELRARGITARTWDAGPISRRRIDQARGS